MPWIHRRQTHEKAGEKIGNFICDFVHDGVECKLTFTTKNCFKQHRKRHQKELEKLIQPDIYPFKCDLCIRVFKKKGSLQSHINYDHLSQVTQPCPVCSNVFQNETQALIYFTSL